eukprot:TRINITY_DN10892_c0_g1_i1.p1 TRINITY_DN10892_c0_g1~~TRINITY_DN10892_c0_g1_i1.p1  ORF type:complete len:319 (+),score=28.72 TRINITY_DN10892_c0_g1_i1:39-995(+)
MPPVVELHISPPCYGHKATTPDCIAAVKLLELSGIEFESIVEYRNSVSVPSLLVYDEEVVKGVDAIEITGFSEICDYVTSCGACDGPLPCQQRLTPKCRAEARAYSLHLRSLLIPSLNYLRYVSPSRKLHRAEMSKSVGLWQRTFKSDCSFSGAEAIARKQLKKVVANENQAMALAKEAYAMLDTLLATGESWYVGILGLEMWAMLVSHMTHSKLKVEIDRRPRLTDFVKKYEKECSHEVSPFSGLRLLSTQPDPHTVGRTFAVLFMTTFTAAYIFKYSFTLRNIINMLYRPVIHYSKILFHSAQKSYSTLMIASSTK